VGTADSGVSRLKVLLYAAVFSVAACSSKTSPPPGTAASPSTSAAPPIAKTSSNEFNYDDPCTLLEPKEVEAVLGAPLAIPPYRAAGAGARRTAFEGHDCVYDAADFQRITLTVEFHDGASGYKMVTSTKSLLGSHPDANVKKAFRLADGTELAGEWDEATLMPMRCCDFLALRADRTIEIDFTNSKATLAQAASLVDTAFKRIDKPLKIDGTAAIDAAAARAAQLGKPRDPCSLVTRAEAESILGNKLIADPVVNTGGDSGEASCTYELPRSAFVKSTHSSTTGTVATACGAPSRI
jgi:hypothetical protein